MLVYLKVINSSDQQLMCNFLCSCTDQSGSPVCDQCLPQYSKPHCVECSAGFYKSAGICVPCDCNGNADPLGPPQLCHPDTGHCLRCINGTTGTQCQLCAPGFIGDNRKLNCTHPSKSKTHCWVEDDYKRALYRTANHAKLLKSRNKNNGLKFGRKGLL